MSIGIENSGVYVAAQLTKAEINLYGDAESLELTVRYDPLTYQGKRCSGYCDSGIEMVASPLAVIGYSFGRYFGLDRKGLDHAIMEFEGMPIRVGNEPAELVPDFRIEAHEGETVYFPTASLLEAFGVQLIESPQPVAS
jgi:hypothetical protein